jgi:hypothetical protein
VDGLLEAIVVVWHQELAHHGFYPSRRPVPPRESE